MRPLSYKLLLSTALALLVASPAFALSVTYDIDAYLVGIDFGNGPVDQLFEDIGFATFEMPDSGSGEAVLSDFELNILGESFYETDDWYFPNAPTGAVKGGELVGVQFRGRNENGALLWTNGTFAFSMQIKWGGHFVACELFFDEADGGGSGGGATPMPEPSAALVFAAGLATIARRSRLI